jgi:hypothetical protein
MFTHDDIRKIRWEELDARPVLVPAVEFEPHDFDNRGEDYAQVFCAGRACFDSVLSFWTAIVKQELPPGRWLDEYLARGSLRPIPLDTYPAEISMLLPPGKCSLPANLVLSGRLIDAARLHINFCDMALLATFEDRYVAARWFSTA